MNFTRCQLLSFSFILLLTIVFFFAVYVCTGRQCLSQFDSTNLSPTADFEAFLEGRLTPHQFNKSDLLKQRKLDLEGEDVFVYLHIQKTGGSSFGKHLVHNLDVHPPCECYEDRKRCKCLTKNQRVWLVSRHSTGWVCGLHADWTEYNDCVEEWFKKNDVESRRKRRYHFISFIRNPVDRFLSEWQHVKRGATWRGVRLHCNGRSATIEEVPFCYTTNDWSGVTFDEFISCEHNLAFNRITRMLADLTKINCYNSSGLDPRVVEDTLLCSAKDNLLGLAFFGLLEYQRATQFLFERTFGIPFISNFEQRKRTHVNRIVVTSEMRSRVIAANRLDIYLYQFAKDLFLQRVEEMERHLGYTVDDYFDRVRNMVVGVGGKQTEHSVASAAASSRLHSAAVDLFEDESTQEAEEKALEWYPSRTKPSIRT